MGIGGLFGVAGGLIVAVPTDFAGEQKPCQDAHQWWCWRWGLPGPVGVEEPYH